MSERIDFSARRAIRVARQHLLATPDRVFSLLCPTREYDWIETWKCRMVHSASGFAELDCVFVTDFPSEGEDVWVVSGYRPNEEIQFVRFNGQRVIRYCITLTDNRDGTTEAEWRQVLTGVNAEGNRLVEGVTDELYQQRIQTLERRLNHYLTTGEMLKGP